MLTVTKVSEQEVAFKYSWPMFSCNYGQPSNWLPPGEAELSSGAACAAPHVLAWSTARQPAHGQRCTPEGSGNSALHFEQVQT